MTSVKATKHIVNWVVWSLAGLYLLTVIAVRVPAVQRWLAEKTAGVLEQKLGTRVSVGRIDLGMFNRIIVDDVLILDQEKREMVKAARLAVKLEVMPLLEGQIAISSAQIFGAHVQLYKPTADAPLNCQFLLDSLASKDTTSHTPLNLRVNSFIMRHSSVSYDQWDVAPTNGRLNPAHLKVDDISAYIILKSLTDDSVCVNVKRLSCVEQSGLIVQQLAFKLEGGRHGAELCDFSLQMPQSQLAIDSLVAVYDADAMEETLRYKGRINDSYITTSDLACFVPQFAHYKKHVLLQADFNGTGKDLTIPQLRVDAGQGDLRLVASGRLTDWKHPSWELHADQLSVAGDALKEVSDQLVTLPEIALRAGNVSMKGVARGEDGGQLAAKGTVQTDAGTADASFSMDANRHFTGEIETSDLNLQRLLDNERFGQLAAQLKLTGVMGQTVEAKGSVPTFGYGGYNYSNVMLEGHYSRDNIHAKLDIADPNATAQIEGSYAKPRIQLNGRVDKLVPGVLNLTDKWGQAQFCADIEADFSANTLNDAQGALSLRNFNMKTDDENYTLNYLRVESGYEEDRHFVQLNSDFAHAELTGTFDYATLTQSITNFIGSKLPTLPGLPKTRQKTDNDFALYLIVDKTDWLEHLLGIHASLEKPLSLEASVNDNTRQIQVYADVPSFTYEGGRYRGGLLHITSPNDTMKIDAALTKLMDDGRLFKLHLGANAADNGLTTSLTWDNNQRYAWKEESGIGMSGRINAVAHFYRNIEELPEAHVSILPSEVIMNGETWLMEPSDILYSADRLLVDHFHIHNADQSIKANGIASKNMSDSLFIDLSDMEVAYILDLVNFHSVAFSGQATGRAYVASAFNAPAAHANLTVNHFKFENGRMGVLTADVGWNKEEEQIDIHATANDGLEATTYINGYVAPISSTQHPVPFIDLGISAHGTYLDFMHSFTESFISHITGHGNGNLRLAGPLSAINLTGQLVADGEATITALNTTYELRHDTINFVYNDILLDRIPVYDKFDNVAYMSGGIHHIDLTQLTFDLEVDTDNLLGYDFKDFGDQSFYGTVFASGRVTLQGRPGRVTIDCDVTPLKNSVFVYNAANPDAISSQEFITWSSRKPGGGIDESEPLDSFPRVLADIPTDIYLNFRVNAIPDGTMRLLMDAKTNDYINLNGNGTIRATYYNKGTFEMFGTYTVESGTYDVTIQNIIKKNFQFQPGGTIVFGGNPYHATLNLQALYTVNGVSLSDLNIGNSFASNTIRVNCLMNIGGQPEAPQVTFDLDMPTVNADEEQMIRSLLASQQEMNQQVLYLLSVGRFYNQPQNNAGQEQQQSQTSLAMQSFLSGTLSTQINTVLNQLLKNDDWNFGANISTGTEGWNNAEYEGIVNGRMLNNRLLINGQFGYRDNATQATPSFIGDFDIRYLLYPNGNLALKVYNQTNDRYFTRSSLNTQGIGLIMKKDFGPLEELFTRKKKQTIQQKDERNEDYQRPGIRVHQDTTRTAL